MTNPLNSMNIKNGSIRLVVQAIGLIFAAGMIFAQVRAVEQSVTKLDANMQKAMDRMDGRVRLIEGVLMDW